MAISDEDARRARAFLHKRGFNTAAMPARSFAAAAEETGRSYKDMLGVVAALQLETQGQGPAPIATKIAMEGKG